MHHMFDTGTDMIIFRGKEYLCLVLQPPEGIRMNYCGCVPEVVPPLVLLPGILSFSQNFASQLILKLFHALLLLTIIYHSA